MARYIYKWRNTEAGKRLFRLSPGPRRRPSPAAAPDYASLKKNELIELADATGIDSSGTKADIVARLEADR